MDMNSPNTPTSTSTRPPWLDAVECCDVEAVREALRAGADPNQHWTVDGEPGIPQPTSPLALVLFRISDSMLDDAGLRACAEIAEALLEHGADPAPALRLAEARYGPHDAAMTGLFAQVWHVVARG
jgi:hypothetical protein